MTPACRTRRVASLVVGSALAFGWTTAAGSAGTPLLHASAPAPSPLLPSLPAPSAGAAAPAAEASMEVLAWPCMDAPGCGEAGPAAAPEDAAPGPAVASTAAIPAPAALALLGLAMTALGVLMHRKEG